MSYTCGMNAHATRPVLLFTGLVLAAVVSRFLWIAPNFTAVGAAALFAGFMFRSRGVAAGVPIVAMLISDAVIGFYQWPVMLAVYGSLAAPALFGRLLRGRAGATRVAGCSVAGSVLFFVATNFAVWACGAYGHDSAGLAACYTAAIPFFKYTLAGDLVYAGVFFGVHALATSRVVADRPLAVA